VPPEFHKNMQDISLDLVETLSTFPINSFVNNLIQKLSDSEFVSSINNKLNFATKDKQIEKSESL
jgi:hypothetical protein